MDSFGKYAQFTSITPTTVDGVRPGGVSSHRFTLNWSYPTATSGTYTRVKVYRFIGDVNSCNPSSFTFNDNLLVFNKGTDEVSDLTTITTCVDDLADYYNGVSIKPSLSTVYGFTGLSDKQILDEIYYSKRYIYYVIMTYTKGGSFDTVPYVLTSHTDTGYLQCLSTKTQVKHNILHLEGERIWSTQLKYIRHDNNQKHVAVRLSRTCLDINQVYVDSIDHGGPGGYGGWAWVSGRGSLNSTATEKLDDSHVYRVQVRTGQLMAAYYCSGQNGKSNGFGVAVDASTGNCYAGTYGNTIKKLYNCAQDLLGNVSGTSFSVQGYLGGCYGLTPQYGNINTYWASMCQNSDGGVKDFWKIYKQNGVWRSTKIINADDYNIDIYGIVAGPDGTVFFDDYCADLSKKLYRYNGTNISKVALTNDKYARGIGVENINAPPNEGTSTYRVWVASSSVADIAHRKVFFVDYNYITKTFITTPKAIDVGFYPFGVGNDSENGIWIAGGSDSGGLAKIYRHENNTDFPFGGNCRWPTVSLSAWPYSFTNNREVEWFLTREPTLMSSSASAAYNNMIVHGSKTFSGLNSTTSVLSGYWISGSGFDILDPTLSAAAITEIYNWDTLYSGNTTNIQGRSLYPGYDTAIPMYDVRWKNFTPSYSGYGRSYMYSDFTGSVLVGSMPEVPSNFSAIHPDVTYPQANLVIDNAMETSPLQESSVYPWKTVIPETSSNVVFGYDDLRVNFRGVTNPGSFIITGWYFVNDDYYQDRRGEINPLTVLVSGNSLYRSQGDYITDMEVDYIYHDPSMKDLPTKRVPDIRSSTGTFMSYLSVYSNKNPYTCQDVYAISLPCSATVFERWPEARMSIDHFSLSADRYIWFGCPLSWKPVSRFEKETSQYFGRLYSTTPFRDGNVAYGVDPLSADIVDRSISRSYPISSWYFKMGTTNIWSTAFNTWGSSTEWPRLTSFTLTTNDPDFAPEDTANVVPLKSDVYRYGLYGFTLQVEASNTGTLNADSTGGVTDYTQYLRVDEFEPFANFWPICALTVPVSYTDEPLIVASSYLLNAYIGYDRITPANLVSGYAPNVTVYFVDSSEAHTFPISSYHWNFGDYYDEDRNTQVVLTTSHVGVFDWGCWTMDKTNHIAEHTYVMPGVYDVTLCVQASNTSTQDCSVNYANAGNFQVYVEEILPQCCYQMSLSSLTGWGGVISGTASLTVYFNASCIIPGSFPIGRLDWDFGDGSEIQSVSRSPYSSTLKDGTPITLQTLISGVFPINEPRDYIVRHTYDVPGSINSSTFNVSLSVYACNTNTMVSCSGGVVGPVVNKYADQYETRHLIGSRFINNTDDIMYLFEGNKNTTYAVVLSAGE